ncbi:MAG: hypothetical protein OXQ29_14740 [Rhodospirillaceae bacterium]|nr:hypothetical protein [Rhodospirillaceae bacterium]
MKAAIRCRSLTLGGSGNLTLHSMEAHGKRLDGTGRARRVREAEPLVFGSLDLRREYDAHVAGTRQNAALKRPVLHFVCQFPTALKIKGEDDEKWMLDQAVGFVNGTHGGQAVFAARLDRDEAGRHTVDVFAAPKYEKRTRRTPPDRPGETWISPTRHGKELCGKHRDEIERRHKGRFTTGPRQVGIALNSEWADHLRRQGYEIEPKSEKPAGPPDRLEPEQLKAARDELAEAERRRDEARAGVAEIERRWEPKFGPLSGSGRRDQAQRDRAFEAALREIERETASPLEEEDRWKVHDRPRWEEIKHTLNPGRLGWGSTIWGVLRRVSAVLTGEVLQNARAKRDTAVSERNEARKERDTAQETADRVPGLEETIRTTRIGRDRREAATARALTAIAEGRTAPARTEGRWDNEMDPEWWESGNQGLHPGPLGWGRTLWDALHRVGQALLTARRERDARPTPEAAAGLRATSAHRLLILGASGGSPEMIDQAIGEGADPDRRLEHGRRMTALHAAVVWTKPVAVRQLLKVGADPDVRDAKGQTPADMARTIEGEAADPARRKLLSEIIEALDPPEPERDHSPGFSP